MWNLLWFVPLAVGLLAAVSWWKWIAYKRYRKNKETDAYYAECRETPPWAPPAPWTPRSTDDGGSSGQ